ncbi:hypothetical protein M8818_007029 [Zalaria obscura]|uniref:Uncharacterized protein n=1 Tax=Zalaria obscura TaxID=2024903 RepID=A0ACC3S3V2_9PEZI
MPSTGDFLNFPRPSSLKTRISLPDIESSTSSRQLQVVFASTGCTDRRIVEDVLPKLASLPDVSLRAVLDQGFRGADFISASSTCLTIPNAQRGHAKGGQDDVDIEQEAAELCQWADILVLAPIDANNIAKMLHGDTDSLVLEILRCWNVSKKILMVPGMSNMAWENPMTKKQLTKIKRKWNWIQVLQPLLWSFEDGNRKVTSWKGLAILVETVRNQVVLKNIGQDVDVSPSHAMTTFKHSESKPSAVLPPELWTMIMDATGDWELAQTLHIYTNLPPPTEWQRHARPEGPQTYMEQLEWTILTGDLSDVKSFIATHSVPRWLSRLCIRLIMRFAMIPLLSHLETHHNDLFWSTFGHTFLPDKASSVFGRLEILDFWNTSPSFLTKKYTAEALDGASRQGFVHVLEWWQKSRLPLTYTEAAFEQASSHGHVAVLDWWRNLAFSHKADNFDTDTEPVRVKPGKSICYATQSGNAEVVRWWVRSGIPFPHEDTVAKLASTHGHVEVLKAWHECKESKMIFDNQVLVGATKMGHVEVLEWWKRSGLRVEYKTCDVEEALEDGVEGRRGEEVRRWWARNGLNLGVGTSEWMKPKVL